MRKKPLVIIGGATGVGKTELSVRLAQLIGAQIISADSMQVYKGFDIGTAKIRPDETGGIKHYLIDEIEPDGDFNIFEFQARAKSCIDEIISERKIPMIVGGTGFYVQSVLYDIHFEDESGDRSFRRELEMMAEEGASRELYEMLKSADPKAAEQIHPNNTKRIIRALEFYHETGGPISRHNEEQKKQSSPYDFVYFVLNRDRASVYDRINRRVDIMMEEGLEEEVRGLLDKGVSMDSPAMGGLGYKEMVSYIRGEITKERAEELIRQNTRHFAKRQLTWYRREKDVIWVNYEDFDGTDAMIGYMAGIIREKLPLESMF